MAETDTEPKGRLIDFPLTAERNAMDHRRYGQSVRKERREKLAMLAWKFADRLSTDVSHGVIVKIAQQVKNKDALWDKYLYDSKPMLPPDFFLTELMNDGYRKSDQFPDGFRVPPRTQWFLAHPSFAIEYSSAAQDGEQLKPVLYLELVGANRWNEKERWFDIWGIRHLSGFSVIASYADRAGVKDTGYGTLITFDNVYSLGIAQYGSDTGVFLSLDLANLFREKFKPEYQKFKGLIKPQ